MGVATTALAEKETATETLALFVSDMHLQASMPRTAQAFFDFLDSYASKTKQLYLLGDIFECWAGDDDLSEFNRRVVDAIRALSDRGVEVFWIAGNRDFLVGTAFAEMTGLRQLPDPFVTDIAGKRIVLTHGDALCTDDIAYMQFRAQVREPEWQRHFLAQSLEQRKAIVASLRQGSREAQKGKADYIMDVNAEAVTALFTATQCNVMIHGHTHRPAQHLIAANEDRQVRYVLPDWDCDTSTPRGGWITIQKNGTIVRRNYSAAGASGECVLGK
jgi:UDP-2,3-diacylglucosamine hydrolase